VHRAIRVASGPVFLGAFLLLSVRPARALDPSTPLPQYGHDVWTSDSGLPQNSITAILQTRDGYLWLGTQEGLARFDGVRFTTFDSRNTPAFRDDWVVTLLEARDGTLWVGTVAGLARMRGGEFLPPLEGPLGSAMIEALHEGRDGSLWVSSEAGVFRLRDGRAASYGLEQGLPGPRTRAFATDASGTLWAAGPWGVARLDSDRFEAWTVAQGFPAGVFALAPDGDGGMWAGTSKGLAHVRGRDVTLWSEAAGVSPPVARVLYSDRDGNLWLGTENGLLRFRDGKFVRHGMREGLSSDRVLSIAEDREGSLWIGTSDGGLNRIKEQRIAIFTTRDGLSDEKMWSVFEDREGNLWAGTAEGVLNRLVPGTDRFAPFVSLGASVMCIAEDASGALWIGTRGGGLVRLVGRRITRFGAADGISSSFVSSVLVSRSGEVWVGTMGGGLNRYSHGRWTSWHAKDGLGSDGVFSIFEDRDGALWVGTFGGGVVRVRNGSLTRFTTADGLAHDVVMSAYQDSEGTYWFATRGGLSRYSGGRFTTYRQREGIFHDAAQRVIEDGRGYLWLTSNRGVFRVLLSELEDAAASASAPPAAGEAPRRIAERVTFTTAIGMIRAECNGTQQGALRGRDGRLWFPTVKGLAMADPARIELNPVAPSVVIEHVLADGRPAAGPSLPVETRRLELQYTALALRYPHDVRFRYRLEGFDRDWVDAGTRRSAWYTNLPPGRYRFRVRAANEDGVWNEAGAAVPLEIPRRFTQTAAFRALVALALAALGTLLYRLRVRRLEIRERLRTALVEAQLDALQFQLRPHFLFNTLNSILPLVGRDPERARQMVIRLGELLRLSLQSEDTPLVTLEEEVAILEKYLSIERVRFRDRLEATISVAPETASARVPSFLLQPLVENAIQHGVGGRAGAGRIEVTAAAEGGDLVLRVRDDGPGPKAGAAETTTGIGLRNTRRRLEALYPGRHELSLRRGGDGGAEATIRVPLTHAFPAAAQRISRAS
jgi:ligand-binding sensor domain-containing protein